MNFELARLGSETVPSVPMPSSWPTMLVAVVTFTVVSPLTSEGIVGSVAPVYQAALFDVIVEPGRFLSAQA